MSPVNQLRSPILCRCLGITTGDVVDALESGAQSDLDELRRVTGAGDGCTACHRRIREFLGDRRTLRV